MAAIGAEAGAANGTGAATGAAGPSCCSIVGAVDAMAATGARSNADAAPSSARPGAASPAWRTRFKLSPSTRAASTRAANEVARSVGQT